MLPQLNIHLYALPSIFEQGPMRMISGSALTTINCADVSHTRLPTSFEQAVERLEKFDRLFIELDGSFVWTGTDRNGNWQLDGMLYDYAGRLQRVELKGTCPLPEWHTILHSLATTNESVVVHLLDHQCFISAKSIELLWSRSSV